MSCFESTFLHANPTLDEEKCTLTPDFLAAAIAAAVTEQLCKETLTGRLLRPGCLTLTGPRGESSTPQARLGATPGYNRHGFSRSSSGMIR
jgi:hypothetical protein